MSRPLIGIVPSHWAAGPEGHYRISRGYMQWVRRAGGIACMLHYDSDPEYAAAIAQRMDGMVFAGGPDIDPAYFGELPIPGLRTVEPVRDSAEQALFEAFYPTRKPILGICKGMQVVNVFMGGTLYQDIDAQYPQKAMGHTQGCGFNVATHPVTLAQDGPLSALLGGRSARVNTFHHQAVKDLAPGLRAMAHAEDGIIEALWAPEHPFLWGTQFHPEMFDPGFEVSEKIFGAFMAACR